MITQQHRVNTLTKAITIWFSMVNILNIKTLNASIAVYCYMVDYISAVYCLILLFISFYFFINWVSGRVVMYFCVCVEFVRNQFFFSSVCFWKTSWKYFQKKILLIVIIYSLSLYLCMYLSVADFRLYKVFCFLLVYVNFTKIMSCVNFAMNHYFSICKF